MTLKFETDIFTDECRETLAELDKWSHGRLREGVTKPNHQRRQQGGGGVMFWSGIVDNTIIGPFKVPEGVKITSEAYINFLTKYFIPWYKTQPLSFKRKALLMQDGAPAHSARVTKAFLAKIGFKDERLMTWPANSPDLNPIENLWSIIKRRVYVNGRQFKTKTDLWEAIQNVCKGISPQEVKNLTASVDRRLFNVIKKGGKYINM